MQLRAVVATGLGLRQLLQGGSGQFGRQGHFATLPLRHRAALLTGFAYISGHVFNPHQFQYAPGKNETITTLETGDKTFFDLPQSATG